MIQITQEEETLSPPIAKIDAMELSGKVEKSKQVHRGRKDVQMK